MFGPRSKSLVGAAQACAAVVVCAAPASAAPVTLTTDAGTRCTLDSDAMLGAGLAHPAPGETFVSLPAGCGSFGDGPEVLCSATDILTAIL